MNMRRKWADVPESFVNVTSCQGKLNKNRRDFSPMTFIEGGYKGYSNFEAFWQAGKVLYAQFDGENMDYITSRKKVYVPLYFELIKDKEMSLYWWS
jgi:hypothetical protein